MNYDCEFSSYNSVPYLSPFLLYLVRGTFPLIFCDIGRDCILEKVIPSFFWKAAGNKCRFFLFNWSRKTREHIVTPCFRVFQHAGYCKQMLFFNILSDLIAFFPHQNYTEYKSHDLQENYIHMQQSQGKHWHSEQAVACWKGKRGDVLRILSTRLDMLIVKCTGRFSE